MAADDSDMKLPPAPKWAVPVRVSFMTLMLSRACSFRTAWLLTHGALTSPFNQDLILEQVALWRLQKRRLLGNIWDAVTMPFDRSCRI